MTEKSKAEVMCVLKADIDLGNIDWISSGEISALNTLNKRKSPNLFNMNVIRTLTR